MRPAVVSATAVGLAIAAALIATLSLRESGSAVAASRAAPEVVRVTCAPDGAVVDVPTVRAGEAGVRFVVQNPSQAQFLRLRPTRELGRPVEMLLTGGAPNEAILPIAPGNVRVSCLRDRSSGQAPVSELAIVDPQGLWISPELACSEVHEREFQTPFAGVEEGAVDTVRRTIRDLASGLEIAKPGYPQTRWHGDLLVLIQEGRTVGRVTRAQDQGGWTVTLSTCFTSGIVDP